jgi:DNA sulfur modification protein DndD
MIFTELVLENFGAYAGKQVINLRTDSNENIRPIILFGGMNGGGKTTLMDAIRLALYGHRAKCSTRKSLGYGEFLSQCCNKQCLPGDNTSIELSFEYIFEGHWQQFKIIRVWNRVDKDIKDSLSIKREDSYDDNLRDNWDEYIENILPLGISNLFLFDGEQVKDLAELDTPPSSVVESINSLLGLELAERLAVDLEVLVSRKRKALANKEQLATIEEIETKLQAKQQERETVKQKLADLQTKLKQAEKHCDRAYNKFKKEGGKIAAEREHLASKIQNLNKDADSHRETLSEIVAGILPLSLITPLLAAATTQGQQEVKVQQFKQAQNIISDRDTKLLAYLQDISLSAEAIDKINFFIQQENEVIANSIAAGENKYLNINEEELQQLVNYQDRLTIQQKIATECINKIKDIEVQRDSIEHQLSQAASPEDYQKLDDAVQEARQEVSNCKSLYHAAENKIQDLDKEIDRIQQELSRKLKNLSEDAINRHNDEHIIASADKVQQTLSLFREKLTQRKLNKLETEVTGCFRYLLHKSNLVHRVVIESNTFRLSLYDPQGLPLPKQRLSAGEKQLLAIGFLWGLARVSGKNLPVAIDTPLGRLDSSHRSNLIERYFPSASHQVILLSTDTEIGQEEITLLREQEAISQEYLLNYNPDKGQTTVEKGYFW